MKRYIYQHVLNVGEKEVLLHLSKSRKMDPSEMGRTYKDSVSMTDQ